MRSAATPAERALQRATRKRERAEAEWHEAMKRASDEGMTHREIAPHVGVSYQRVGQILKALALTVVLVVLMGASAEAHEPFLPGQARSLALAISYWHPPCARIGLEPMQSGDSAEGGASAEALAWPGQCLIHVDRAATISGAWTLQGERRLACTVILHEVGHLAGQEHSDDPRSPMNPYVMTTAACRRLWPMPRRHRRS